MKNLNIILTTGYQFVLIRLTVRKALMVIGLLFVFGTVYGQQPQPTSYFEYTYDASGNRIQRIVILIPGNQNARIIDTTNQDSGAQVEQNANAASLFTDKIGNIEVSIFPNPTTDKITLKINSQEQIQGSKIIIYNNDGNLLMQNENLKQEQRIDFSNYTSGIYYLKVILNGADKTYKIIKEN